MTVLTGDGRTDRSVVQNLLVELLAHDILSAQLSLGLLEQQHLIQPFADHLVGLDTSLGAIGTSLDILHKTAYVIRGILQHSLGFGELLL